MNANITFIIWLQEDNLVSLNMLLPSPTLSKEDQADSVPPDYSYKLLYQACLTLLLFCPCDH